MSFRADFSLGQESGEAFSAIIGSFFKQGVIVLKHDVLARQGPSWPEWLRPWPDLTSVLVTASPSPSPLSLRDRCRGWRSHRRVGQGEKIEGLCIWGWAGGGVGAINSRKGGAFVLLLFINKGCEYILCMKRRKEGRHRIEVRIFT